jgi:hypothetical protein
MDILPKCAVPARLVTAAALVLATVAGCRSQAGARRPAVTEAELVTDAERSRFVRTGRYDEVIRLCGDFELAFPARALCTSFGTTPEGRPMHALVVSADGALDPAVARRRGRPVVLVQAGIHAGEIEGKDAGFMVLRELLAGRLVPGALAAVTIVFVPVFNVDGHEHFGPNHRVNQRGPEAMGFRVTGQNLNLNRDYMKADAPEMHAMLGLWARWDPTVFVDLHTTDGAKFEHDVAVMVAPELGIDPGLEAAARSLSAALQDRLTALGHLPTRFYPSFRTYDEPSSGFSTEPALPRFSQAYAATRNRIGILVETHSWKTYGDRVAATRDVLTALLERALVDAPAWRLAAHEADLAATKRAGRDFVLDWGEGTERHDIDFRGYAYRKVPSEISGGTWIVYDENTPQIWRVPLYDQPVPEITATAPGGGYIVSAAYAASVGALLDRHGIEHRPLGFRAENAAVATFLAQTATADKPFEGRTPMKVTGKWRETGAELTPADLFVPIAQARSALVLHLFEPLGPDSLVRWGFFNAVFERKEYMEAYVAEEEARRMLEADPALKAAFEERLRTDPAFKGSPAARLDFFYQRHPAWGAERALSDREERGARERARGERARGERRGARGRGNGARGRGNGARGRGNGARGEGRGPQTAAREEARAVWHRGARLTRRIRDGRCAARAAAHRSGGADALLASQLSVPLPAASRQPRSRGAHRGRRVGEGGVAVASQRTSGRRSEGRSRR